MHCKTCEYALWNLTARQCPECGQPFKPSDFEFKPGSVCFCCPHCGQPYYGTGETGHLVPPEFDCVQCGRHINMDEMSVHPAEGVAEKDTRGRFNPWLERRHEGRFRGWIRTVGRALIKPGQLMQATPPESSAWQAWWFAIVTGLVIVAGVMALIVPLILLIGFLAAGRGGGGPGINSGQLLLFAGIGSATMVAMTVFSTFINIGIWGAVAHGLLRLTGTLEHGIGRTYQAMCYSSGANIIALLMFCGGHYAAFIWWMVSATVMVKDAHKVHGGRAAFAVLTGPVLMIAIGMTIYGIVVGMIIAEERQQVLAAQAAAFTAVDTTRLNDGVLAYGMDHNGAGPPTALMLAVNGDVEANNFIPFSAEVGDEPLYPGAIHDFSDFQFGTEGSREVIARAAAASMPEGAFAHRVGDYVFTYHGVDLIAGDGELWVLILAPLGNDPTTGQSATHYTVGYANGSTEQIAVEDFMRARRRQNTLRLQYGLPRLPDPATITQEQPAIAPGN